MDKDRRSEIHITNNFNAPIGQHIDHVDTINFRMDGDGTFHFGMVDTARVEKEDAGGDGKPKEGEPKEPPAICLEAVKKVVTPQFTLNGSVFNSQAQLRKAVGEIDLGKNVEIGILMVICKEVGLVKSGISDTDFVRALIGMRFIEYEDDKQITRIAHGFSKKTNNLPPKHTQWSGTDRTLGDRLYEVLRQG
jgi:hypothetical protein